MPLQFIHVLSGRYSYNRAVDNLKVMNKICIRRHYVCINLLSAIYEAASHKYYDPLFCVVNNKLLK